MNLLLKISIALTLTATALGSVAGTTVDEASATVVRLNRLDSDSLMSLGREYGYEKHQVGDALSCFTIVADRYDPARMNEEEQMQCVEALNMQYEVFSNSMFDYSRAYNSLSQATDIIQRLGREDAHLQFNYGAFYQQSFSNTNDVEYLTKAMDCYKRAYRTAKENNDPERLNMIVPNMISIAVILGELDNIKDNIAEYSSLPNNDEVFRQFNLLLFKGVTAMADDRPSEALESFRRQLEIVPDVKVRARLRCMSFLQLGNLYQSEGNMEKALAMADSVIATAGMYGVSPAVVAALKNKENIFRTNHLTESALRARLDYLQAKDSLVGERISNNVRSVALLDNLNSVGIELRRTREQKEMFLGLFAGVAAALVVVFVFAGVITNKNKRLRLANRELYLKNSQLVRAEKVLKEVPERRSADVADESPALKQLWKRIQEIVYSTDEIYSPDFNIARLAELADSNTRYVSAAINGFYGSGFQTFIGDFRVKEACRRIQDFDNYGNLTLDNIAFSVGIKSRTTFSNSFKRVVGMTPSEYLRQAKDNIGK